VDVIAIHKIKKLDEMEVAVGSRPKASGRCPICKVCGNEIGPDRWILAFKRSNELPQYYHRNCGIILVKVMKDLIKDSRAAQGAEPWPDYLTKAGA
jgi:hypothetical protein